MTDAPVLRLTPKLRPRRLVRRVSLAIFAAPLFCLLMLTAYVGLEELLFDNFHVVAAGELYRSAQISPVEIDRYAERYGIKTIVNLRGSQGSKPAWYQDELAESARDGVRHVNFRLSARREPTAERISALIELLRTARKPILLHCDSGADRSGLAAALYLAAVKHVAPAVAAAQLSFWYGHIPLPISSAYAMDRAFEAYERDRTASPRQISDVASEPRSIGARGRSSYPRSGGSALFQEKAIWRNEKS